MELHCDVDPKFLDDVAEGPDLHQDGLRWHIRIVPRMKKGRRVEQEMFSLLQVLNLKIFAPCCSQVG
jgi:hypothetical protein